MEERRRRFGVGWGLRTCIEDRGVMKPSKILFELLHNEYTTARLAVEKLPEYKKMFGWRRKSRMTCKFNDFTPYNICTYFTILNYILQVLSPRLWNNRNDSISVVSYLFAFSYDCEFDWTYISHIYMK